ncbi:MAG: glycosyltransferase family 2 protein [Myxococcales bacterium]|nr:glycosyltransferase family 2 protein [Myxococcales bacterium]
MAASDPQSEPAGGWPEGQAAGFTPCALIPTYNNPRTLRAVVEQVRAHLPVVVVDDGSAAEGRREAERLAADGLAAVTHRERNGGKGAAVKTGFVFARSLGYTHALQVDADGQHALADIPEFLAAARRDPSALILGAPVYDASAPRGRLIGRRITLFWTDVEAGRGVIRDPMCGFRVYPLAAALAVGRTGDRMDFDIEVAVRMAWMGVPIVNLPTKVRYLSAAEGGVSHFRMVRDNFKIGWLHTRLSITALLWLPILRLLGRAPRRRLTQG